LEGGRGGGVRDGGRGGGGLARSPRRRDTERVAVFTETTRRYRRGTERGNSLQRDHRALEERGTERGSSLQRDHR
jgi:hypothetical protein